MKLPKMLKGYWAIGAIVLSFFVVDWQYIQLFRSLFSYQIQNNVNRYLTWVIMFTGFSWSQTLKATIGGTRASHVLKIVAPLKYKKGKEARVGYKILQTYDLGNPRVEPEDVYEELGVFQRGKEPEAILIRKVIPPPQPSRYQKKLPDW
jgi:hypothetical protein